MSARASVALGSVLSSQDATPMTWAFLSALRQQGRQVQIFRDQARFVDENVCHSVCGQSPRYLDSWLMSPALCRETFAHGMHSADFGLILGSFDRTHPPQPRTLATLDPVCDWLDLPRIAIVDVASADSCRIPACLANAAGVLLDNVPRGKFIELQTVYESLWGVPVLGGLPELPELRQAIHKTGAGDNSACTLCQQLGRYLSATMGWKRLWELSHRGTDSHSRKIFQRGQKLDGLRIAVAFDEAIHHYYPEVLELLELQGATVEDFSLLRDQSLPAATDVVYLGGGHPEKYAAALSGNQCLALALQDHVRQGRRIYAEGAGAALLAQYLELPDGQHYPMFGVIPAVAKFDPNERSCQPAELTLTENHWLGGEGSILRGYRDDRWQLDFTDSLVSLAENESRPQLFAWQQVVASLVHINFAVQPGFLQRFSHSGAVV